MNDYIWLRPDKNLTSFNGGGSLSTWREPLTMGKQLVSFITCGCELSAPSIVIYKVKYIDNHVD
jgi:hypothetical protein